MRDRVHDAETTVARYCAGGAVKGFGTLAQMWPEVAEAIFEQLGERASGSAERVSAELATRPIHETVSLASATEELTEELERAASRASTTVLHITTGAGKSDAAVNMAIDSKVKTALVFATNAQACECFDLIASHRTDVRRLEGTVASSENAPRCPHVAAVECFHDAGLSVPVHLCLRCGRKSACPERLRARAHSGAAILVTNHALLDFAIDHVGKTGMLVIDESPALFEHVALRPSDMELALQGLDHGWFYEPFAKIARPLVMAARYATPAESVTWRAAQVAVELERTDPTFQAALREAELLVGQAASGAPPFARVVAAVHTYVTQRGSVEPELSHDTVEKMLRGSADLNPKAVAAAARTIKTLFRALGLRDEASWTMWTDVRMTGKPHGDGLEGQCCFANPTLVRALSRGHTVLLDATADGKAMANLAHLKGMEEIVIEVEDAAPIDRGICPWSQGTRSRMLRGGRTDWTVVGPAFARALEQVMAANAKTVLLITHKPVVKELGGLLKGTIPHSRAANAYRAFADTGGRLLLAHYSNVRGRNEFEGVKWPDIDALVTLGDPIPNLGQLRVEASLLRLTDAEAQQRIDRAVAAELAQAHGRLRTPRRTTPALSIHVGQAVPLGWHQGNTRIAQNPRGRPLEASAMAVSELQELVAHAGGVAQLARATELSRPTIYDFRSGKRPISKDMADKLRAPWSSRRR